MFNRYADTRTRIGAQALIAVVLLLPCVLTASAQQSSTLRGDPAAIADAIAMVETMGGAKTWCGLDSLHFVHEWDVVNRTDRYLENEILDLTGPRSYVKMESEGYERIRAYSPEHRYWSVQDGKFSYGDDESLANAMERAPYNLYRLARQIGCGKGAPEIRFGAMEGLPRPPALEFVDDEGIARGWIVLNARKEPIIWATTQYVYVFGPLRQFGALRLPDWATTSEGLVRYEMVSLEGSGDAPDLTLFEAPDQG